MDQQSQDVDVVSKAIGPESSFYSDKNSNWVPNAAAQGVVATAMIAHAMQGSGSKTAKGQQLANDAAQEVENLTNQMALE